MADQADKRLKALRASIKEALGKLTGSDALEAEGARERSGGAVAERGKAEAHAASPARKAARRPSKGKPRRST